MRHQADRVRLRVTNVLVAAEEQALGRFLRSTLRRMGFRHILNVCSAREVIQQRQGRYGVV
jgi:hypothetical protein